MALRSVPRKVALAVLTEVLAGGRALDDAIESRSGGISSADRAWLVETTSGVLRNLRRLDLAIDAYALKKKPTGKLRKILQIGAYQLIHQDRVFPATVVSETVDFVREEEGEPPAKFANALLRRIGESRAEWKAVPPPGSKSSVAEKAAWANLPEWWWKKWEKEFGTEKAFKIAERSLDRPDLWFRFSESSPLDTAVFSEGPVSHSARLKDSAYEGGVTGLPGFQTGNWIVQDLASQILVEKFSEILRANRGPQARLLDRCAAPGGKAVAMAWKGFSVSAMDQDHARLRLVEENVKRTRTPIQILENSSEVADEYDAIWIDAPCTGSGILRRHPDVRWLRKEADLENLKKIQKQLLEEAFAALPAGGQLFYSVCSLFREEGRAHIDALGWIDSGKAKIENELWLTPDSDPSTDGFFGVAIQKN